MKKNISINIFGTLYPIDEDAYELLKKYNDNMRRYYSQRDGGDEIADDVEHRVAELLSELRANGIEAITIEHIKEIIDRIGDPQEMDDSEEQPEGRTYKSNANEGASTNGQGQYETPPASPSSRKLYRDPEDKVLGGVMSGLSHYLGLSEPLILRLIMVVLLIASLSTFGVIYLVAWILIPEAITPEDRLRMYGKPISAKAINEEMMRGFNNTRQFVTSQSTRNTVREFLSIIVKSIVFMIALFGGIILCGILITILAAVFGLSVFSIVGASDPDMIQIYNIIRSVPTFQWILIVLSAILILCVPLFALGRVIFKRNDGGLSTGSKLFMILCWILSVSVFIGMAISAAKTIHYEKNRIEEKSNTRHGLYLPEDAWEILDDMGWSVSTFKGIDTWIKQWGSLPDGSDGAYISLSAERNPHAMLYTLSQIQELRPGSYRIEGEFRADGDGNSMFVLTSDNDTLRFSIPSALQKQISEQDIPNQKDSVDLSESGEESNDWNHVEGTFDIKRQGNITYGISNERKYSDTPWNGHSIDVANVKIVKLNE